MEDQKCPEILDLPPTQRAVEFLASRLDKRGLAICLSGIDGSGKTTLARQLVLILNGSGVPVRHLHVYQWHVNVFVTPLRLLYNRYVGRKVLVFDRSIYDNVAVASIRRTCPRWLSQSALGAVLACYPKFDYRFYLSVAFTEALVRRPGMDEERFAVLSKAYDEIAGRAHYTRLPSDTHLLAAALRKMASHA